MLTKLTIKSLAIIDEITIDFTNHFSVISGATGSGKSLIVDSLGYLFGKKMDPSLIKPGSSKIVIEGEFSYESKKVKAFLIELGIDPEFLTIKREYTEDKKSVYRINNTKVSLKDLEALEKELLFIHNQGDNFGVFQTEYFLKALRNEEIKSLEKKYEDKYLSFRELEKTLKPKLLKFNEFKEKEDYYTFVLKEYERLDIKPYESEELKAKIKLFHNTERIEETLSSIKNKLTSQNINSLWSDADKLEGLSDISESFEKASARLRSVLYEVDDFLKDPLFSKTSDEQEDIEKLNERLSEINQFKRKHNLQTDEDVIKSYRELKTLVDTKDEFLLNFQREEKTLALKREEVMSMAKELSAARKVSAEVLTKKLLVSLSELNLEHSKLRFQFTEIKDPKLSGIDDIKVLVTFNEGTPLKELSEVASGGEMSRFLLAFETSFNNSDLDKTAIFDEIDSGLSGEASFRLAEKLKSLGKTNQVLAVSHSPQVVSQADTHLLVVKKQLNNNIKVTVKKLTKAERITEIARIISKDHITEASLMAAKELLENKVSKS